MSTCANCEQTALYDYVINPDDHTLFCAAHLPRFLYRQRDEGLLPVTEAFKSAQEDALARLAEVPTSAVEPEIDPEPVAETTVVEEVAAKPVSKKSTKKTVRPAEVVEETVVEETAVEETVVEADPEVVSE